MITCFLIGFVTSLIMCTVAYKDGYSRGVKHTWMKFIKSSCEHGIPFRYKWEAVVDRSAICPECLAKGDDDDASKRV